MHYQSLIAEPLGVDIPDRLQVLRQLRDPGQILELTRPEWKSWGMDEAEARPLVTTFFVPSYSSALPGCPCEAECGGTLVDVAVTSLRRTSSP